LVYENWLKRWNLKSDPCKDIEINNPENLKYLVPTKNTEAMKAEIQDIQNSDVGAIKPVIGSRGAGKTACLYYLIHSLSNHKNILPVYVNMHASLSLIQESPYPITHTIRYVTKELISETAKLLMNLNYGFVEKDPVIKNIVDRAKTQQLTPNEIPEITDDDLELFVKILNKNGLSVVFAIDELDKFETSRQVKNLADFFKNEQALLTKLAGGYKSFFYFSSSTRWEFVKKQEFSYLSNIFYIKRADFLEGKRILKRRFEVSSPGSKLPITDQAIELLISIFNGNPRRVILATGHLLRLAHDRDLDIVDYDLVKQTYSEESRQGFKEDYEEIIATDSKASKGALMIWYLCTRVPPENRMVVLDCLVKIYKKSVKKNESFLLEVLENTGCIRLSQEGKQQIQIHEDIISFFKKWEELGHNIFDFSEWYSDTHVEPPTIPYSYKLVQDLYNRLKSHGAKKNLRDSWDLYFNLEVTSEPLDILYYSWRLLEKMVIAFCIWSGTYEIKLVETTIEDIASRKALEFLGITDPNAKDLLIRFNFALRKTMIKLKNFGLIGTVYQKTQNGSGIKEARSIKDQAKQIYTELLEKWCTYVTRSNLYQT